MYRLEIKYNGNPIAARKYVDYADVVVIIKRIGYTEMLNALDICLKFEELLSDSDIKQRSNWRDVVTCNVVYYDDNDATMFYEVYRVEVRI